MKLESQVSSLELSKKLKELGMKQESLYVWHVDTRSESPRLCDAFQIKRIPKKYTVEIYSAFTVAELGELLPFSFEMKGKVMAWNDYKTSDSSSWGSWFSGDQYTQIGGKFEASTEADARALMLIYLLENKLITL